MLSARSPRCSYAIGKFEFKGKRFLITLIAAARDLTGDLRGLTNTMPLHIEILYNEYNFVAAFAVASLLTMLAVLTLILKALVQRAGHATSQ